MKEEILLQTHYPFSQTSKNEIIPANNAIPVVIIVLIIIIVIALVILLVNHVNQSKQTGKIE